MTERNTHDNPDASRKAAVMVLFSGDPAARVLPDDAAVLLTHRTPTMRSHSGQIAFPGGRVDPEDPSIVAAALRETFEETGISPDTILPLATLDNIFIRATGYPVHPVLGYWHTPGGHHVASPEETDDVFTSTIGELADPAHRFAITHGSYTGPAFRINDYLIWGFTAGVLDAILATSGWEKPWRHNPPRSLAQEIANSRNNEQLRLPAPASRGRIPRP
ncbi:NUDIX hydrolase [Corynebacterium aquilae]|uniref:NUDIX hydrolase n=1 Tax=Corynebacterium aquilae TaxID=203263 RepID=UPI0012EDC452|nr:CoA pyrophosphatase [Corynebacterium aquilae]